MTYNADLISKIIINMSIVNEQPISNLKLQKLLYYTQSAFLCQNHEPAFSDKIAAWKYGPVVEDIYRKYRTYASSDIKEWQSIEDSEVSNFSNEDLAIINNVVTSYSNYSGFEMVDKTHSESPWKDIYEASSWNSPIIECKAIADYYKDKPNSIYGRK